MVSMTLAAVALALGLIVFSVAMGLSKLGSAALEAIARQPEASDKLRGTTTFIAAMIEGSAVIAIMVCAAIIFKA